MTSPGLALLHSDGSLSVLAPAAGEAEAFTLRDEVNALEINLGEPRLERMARVVRVAVEIVEDVYQEHPQHG